MPGERGPERVTQDRGHEQHSDRPRQRTPSRATPVAVSIGADADGGRRLSESAGRSTTNQLSVAVAIVSTAVSASSTRKRSSWTLRKQAEVDELLDPVEVPEEHAVGDDTDRDERRLRSNRRTAPRSCAPNTAGTTRKQRGQPVEHLAGHLLARCVPLANVVGQADVAHDDERGAGERPTRDRVVAEPAKRRDAGSRRRGVSSPAALSTARPMPSANRSTCAGSHASRARSVPASREERRACRQADGVEHERHPRARARALARGARAAVSRPSRPA